MLIFDRVSLSKILIIATVIIILSISSLMMSGCSCYGPRGWPGCFVTNSTMYVGSIDGKVLAVNTENKEEIWHWPPESDDKDGKSGFFSCSSCASSTTGRGMFAAGYFYGSPVVVDDIVYIGAYNGKVYAIDSNDINGDDPDGRDLKWEKKTGGAIVGGVTYYDGVIYVGSSDKKVYAFDAGSGSLKWEFPTGNKVWSRPVVDAGVVYFGSLDHKLYAVDIDNGKLIWDKPFEADGAIISTPLVVDGVVYVGSYDKKLYAVTADTGEPFWNKPFEAKGWFWTEPLYKDGVVYACSLDRNVYAVNATSGEAMWNEPFRTNDPLKSIPVIYNEGDILIVATEHGDVYGINIKDGSRKWKNDLQKEASILAPLFINENEVFICAQNNKVYIVNAETGDQKRTIALSELD